LPAPSQFIELEGDAVFVFAPAEAVEDSERLVEIIEVCYAAFRRRIEQMANNTISECTACRAIPELDLKCVAHYGQYVPQPTPTGPILRAFAAPRLSLPRSKGDIVMRCCLSVWRKKRYAHGQPACSDS